MNTFLNRIDRLMLAITFAEANEPELAKDFLASGKTSKARQKTQTGHMNGGQAVARQAAH